MTRLETQVFTDKFTALRYCQDQSGEFFAATVPGEEPKTVYVVSVSMHRAQVALVDCLMGVTKWSRKKQNYEYLGVLVEKLEKLEGLKDRAEDEGVSAEEPDDDDPDE